MRDLRLACRLMLKGRWVVLAVNTFLACYLPARRASLIDPSIPLRGE